MTGGRFRFPWRTGQEIDREIDDEIALHLELRAEELQQRGITPDEAIRMARAEFGDVDGTRRYCRGEDHRLERQGRWKEVAGDLWQDVGYAVRTLRRAPLFTAVSLLTLALAIGANTAAFSIAEALLLRPLPFDAPEQVMGFSLTRQSNGPISPQRSQTISVPDYLAYRAGQHAFTDIGAYYPGTVTWMPEGGDAVALSTLTVTSSLLPLLRAKPFIGTSLSEGDDRPGAPMKVVLSYRFWRDHLGSDPLIAGKTIRLNDRPVPILGVMPSGFTVLGDEAVWTPVDTRAAMYDLARARKQPFLAVVGRLRPGVSRDVAEKEIGAITSGLAAAFPATNSDQHLSIVPLQEKMTAQVRPALMTLQGITLLILLVACANLGNVTLARALGRRRELAVRASIGAGRSRLIRQLLAESLILSLSGGIAGVMMAIGGCRLLVALDPEILPDFLSYVTLNRPVLLFALLLSLVTGVLFTLIPALTVTRIDLSRSLKSGSTGGSGGRGGEALRRTLIVAQVGAATVLLVGAGILLRSFAELRNIDPGFQTDHLLSARIGTTGARYDSVGTVNRFYDRVLSELRTVPGVTAAAASSAHPLLGIGQTNFHYGPDGDGTAPMIGYVIARSDYFATLGIQPIAGRVFTRNDDFDPSHPTAILNESAALRYFPVGTAIGKTVHVGPGTDGPPLTIVGVVKNARLAAMELPPGPVIFVNHYHNTWIRGMYLLIRTEGDPSLLIPALRKIVHAADPTLALRDVRTFDQAASSAAAWRRGVTTLVTLFALVALVLAAVGVYAALSWGVTSRTREIGVRLALGASGRDVMSMILGHGVTWSFVGILAGLAAAFAARTSVARLVFGVGPNDPATFAIVAIGLIGVTVAASLLPARRAMRVDPMISMRSE